MIFIIEPSCRSKSADGWQATCPVGYYVFEPRSWFAVWYKIPWFADEAMCSGLQTPTTEVELNSTELNNPVAQTS
jgi:hypothetical protein